MSRLAPLSRFAPHLSILYYIELESQMQFRVSEMTLTGIKFVQKDIVVLPIQQRDTNDSFQQQIDISSRF